MTPEIKAALEAAVGVAMPEVSGFPRQPIRTGPRAVHNLRERMVTFLQELPDDLTVRELRDELQRGQCDGFNV